MKTSLFLAAVFLACIGALPGRAQGSDLVVHEWGTFTSLQDEQGNPIAGINTDDEPVPDFVWRLSHLFFLTGSEAPPVFFQGAPSCHLDVTMRLETPVLYFHPAATWKPQPIDVTVNFRGGWLTEYFPAADAIAPGFDAERPNDPFPAAGQKGAKRYVSRFGHLRPGDEGQLTWKNVKLISDGQGPETREKVWLAPRAVQASMLETETGEREKFLFYRGVGNAKPRLQVIRSAEENVLKITAEPILHKDLIPPEMLRIPAAWLVEIRPGGECAFRSLGELPTDKWDMAKVPTEFAFGDFSPKRLDELQAEMRAALQKAGLFADEAEALLRTWEVSYFKSSGLRLFYICPSVEVERLLPLKVSVPCEIKRVMVGRIELVTPEQRASLAKIAAGPSEELWRMRGATADSGSEFFKNPDNLRRWNAVMSGRAPYRELGLPIPPIYETYLQLGRFRNALLLEEEKRRPTQALKSFIKENRFSAYEIP